MAYDRPPTIVTRLYGDDPIWSTVVNNNSEVQATYNPAIIDQPWLIAGQARRGVGGGRTAARPIDRLEAAATQGRAQAGERQGEEGASR